MNRLCPKVAGRWPVGLALTISAFGQSLVDSDRVPAVRQVFEAPASAQPLRCEVAPVRPALNFAFRFQAGYTVDIPYDQFQGSGHNLTVYTRVTPVGREPVYMTKTEALTEQSATRVEAVTSGAFFIGEGTYSLEVLVKDDLHRSCGGAWQIQARRAGSERQLSQAAPPGAVEELSSSIPRIVNPKSGPGIGGITILVHAAPLSSRRSSLSPDDVQRIVDSLTALLRELPAQSVRLIAFNLEQRAVIFRKDGFEANQNGELADALHRLELGLVDYRVLRDRPLPLDLLLGLVQGELRDPKPPDALIVLGPGTRLRQDVRPVELDKRSGAAPAIFNLQFQFDQLIRPGRGPNSRVGTGDALRRPGPHMPDAQSLPATFMPALDLIERLVSRLKGQTIPVRNPHDLADAIQRMAQRIPKTAALPAVTATPEPVANAEAPARKAVPHAPASPAINRPAPEADPPGDEDPVAVLMRLRDQVVAHGERIPNHTCVEMMKRDRHEPVAGRAPKSCDTLLARRKQPDFQGQLTLAGTDWLRLDVAYASGSEIYSWAGASRFEEGELDELVPEGATGTGPFATMLLAVFAPPVPRYIFVGETSAEGRRVFEYSFVVPQHQSHYRVKAHKEWIVTGYTGTLLVDPVTAELVRLVVRTEELPEATDICEADTSLEYGIVQLSGADYLLPKVARQRFIGREGSEAENAMSFSACRQYQAESKVAFGGGAQISGDHSGTPAAALNLPAGLPVSVELLTAIRFGEAAAGDVIEGRLAKPIRDQGQQTLVPAGAAVQGRLMRVERDYVRGVEHTVALRWESVQVDGAMAPFSLLPERRPRDLRTGVGSVLRNRGMVIELPLPSESRYGVFHLAAGREVLASGFRTEWLTARP